MGGGASLDKDLREFAKNMNGASKQLKEVNFANSLRTGFSRLPFY